MRAEQEIMPTPAVPQPRRQRRDLATPLDPETFAQFERVRALKESLLVPLQSEPAERRIEQTVLSAVLATIVFDAVTSPGLFDAIARLQRYDLDLLADILVLPLAVPSATVPAADPHRERVPLSPSSAVLWARLVDLHRRASAAWDPCNEFLLPRSWRDPRRLRTAARAMVQNAGLAPWRRFLHAVQLDALLGGLAPIAVARRAGRLPAAVAPARDWQAAGWPVHDPIGTFRRAARPQAHAGVTADVGTLPAWRCEVRAILRPLRRNPEADARACMADHLTRRLQDPAWRRMMSSVGALFCAWAIALLRNRRRRPNTIRAWLGRIGIAIDRGLLTDAATSSSGSFGDFPHRSRPGPSGQRCARSCSSLRARERLAR
jgi:hypothetical protein